MADDYLLKIPIDYQESPVFRRLAAWFNGRGDLDGLALIKANHVYTSFWRELAYLARDGMELGRVKPGDAPIFQKALTTVTDRGPELYEALARDIRFFQAEAATGDRVCLAFIEFNSHLGPGKRQTRESLGGVMKAFWRNAERAESPAFQQMILISPDRLTDGQGVALDGEMVARMKRLVFLCDTALGKKTRGPHLYTADLIANAVEVCRQMNNDEILAVCAYLGKNRAHPALEGMVTEKLLPRFGDIMRDLNGVE